MTSFVPKSSNGLRKEGTVSGGVSSDPNHHTNDPPGSSRRNGHRAASRAAKGSGIAKFVARYTSSSVERSPICRIDSARGRNRSRRRNAWWRRAMWLKTVSATGSTLSTTVDTRSQAWLTLTDHPRAVRAGVVTTVGLRSLREATCRPHTRGRKLVTRLAARLVSEVREYIPFHNLFRNDEN